MNYGRNFGFLYPPDADERMARFTAPASGVIPIGAPVVADTSAGFDALGLQIVKLAPHASAPVKGLCGIAVYEHAPAAFAGFDPALTTYSDLDTVPLGKAVQVVNSHDVKVVFTNTVSRVFLGTRTYTGRTMVNGFGASPTVAVGDYLQPGLGNDTDGYWESTASATNAWLVITRVNTDRLEVEARMIL